MAGTIIQIKYSGTGGTAAPASGTLTQAELAYSFNSNKMFIGNGDSPTLSHIIGGKHFVDMLDHSAGTLTADSALLVDSNSKIDVLNVDDITINGSTISTTKADEDLTFDPNGTGSVVWAAATSITGDITHGGTLTTTGQINVDNLTLNDKTLSVSEANGDLTLASNGTGKIIVDGTTVVVIPKGTDAQRPTAAAATDGAFRYNTDSDRFEGVASGSWISVGGVRDKDADTYIEPELTTDDDTLRFYIAGTEKAKLNATGFQIDDALEVDGTANIDGNTTVGGTFGATGNSTVGGTFGVTGATTLSSTLGVTSNATVGGTLGVTGNSTLSGTLDVTGATNFNDTTASSSKTTGAVVIDGGVGVAEDIYLGGQIDVEGDATVGGDLAVTGNTVLSGNLTVSGTTTTVDTTVTTLTDPVMHVGQGSLAAGDANDRGVSFEYGDGSVVKDGFFGMDIQTERFVFQTDITSGNADDDEFSSPWSDAQFGSLYLDDNLDVTGTSTLTGNSTVGGTLGVTGATTLSSTLGVTGAATLSSTLGVTSNATVGGTLGVTGATTLSSTVAVTGALSANGGIDTASGDLTIAPAGLDTNITGRLNVSSNLDVDGTVDFANDVPVTSGGTGMSSFTGKGVFIASNDGTSLGFVTAPGSNSEDYFIGFNSSGVPIATKTIDCGTF